MAHSTSPGAPDRITDEELQSMAQHDFEAELTQDQINKIESDYNETWGVKRRITLLALSRSKAELVLNFGQLEDGADVIMEMIDHVHEFREHLRNGIELAESASARLLIACSAILNTKGDAT